MPVNSLESRGFLSLFKAYHPIVRVPEDNDDSRSSHFLQQVTSSAGTGRSIAVGNKKPPACAEGSVHIARVQLTG